MGDVIDFPGHGEASIRKALAYFRQTYRQAGLNDGQVGLAMTELEPIVRSFLARKEFEFSLTDGGFTGEQTQLIRDAHNLAMHSAIQHFSSTLWLALCHIAGLIGRSAQS